ncbi:hypothetical protein E4U43_006084 [Claviceps pusilla]|uniref:Uncharacterized protein n=1 Tax=Claviceps pusilla TaxID=123648 RepID=A0A9P7SV39_9HYPO|nr:hypothetical protein E4U43_006084 [Claviceps pusilla]
MVEVDINESNNRNGVIGSLGRSGKVSKIAQEIHINPKEWNVGKDYYYRSRCKDDAAVFSSRVPVRSPGEDADADQGLAHAVTSSEL